MTDLTLWQSAPLDATVDHILSRYHDTHRRQFDDFIPLAEKVAAVHADSFPADIVPLLHAIADELRNHMMKEERMLFPMIKQGAGRGAAMPIRMMMHEHGEHESAIGQLLALTHDLTPPENACGSWRKLYEELREFVDDLNDHIELENTILFQRALNS